MIRTLSESTINKIAAGEVIENPASVIKELIENSLDAGARHLTIEVKGGGFQLIRVSDDGSGMSRDDAILCFERHATSKISDIDDLASLQSMGFRGEALASIAAISKITLTTAQKEGVQVEVEGGKILSVGPAPRSQGTTFEIRSLFYNVPARKKFQKQPAAASAEIHKLIVTLALAHPEIGFELIANEETVLKVRGEELLEKRIADLFDGSFLASKLQIQSEKQGYQLQGFLGTAADHRVNRTGQYLFVNRRPILSSQVSYAVKDGYGERLDKDRYPVFVLYLDVPPHLLDVNVHPQKREVRFQEGEFLREWVKECVRAAFAPSVAHKSMYFEPVDMERWEASLLLREEPTVPALMETEQVIGIFEHYLLLDGSTVEGFGPGIVWVDLQRAQEELIWQNLNKQEPEILSQGLLLPLSIELSGIEAREFSHRQSDLEKFGFALQSSGKQTFFIEAIPPFLQEGDAIEAVRLVLQSEEPFPKLSKLVARFALRRKKRFMLQEALSLWRSLKQLGLSNGITFSGMHDIESFFR